MRDIHAALSGCASVTDNRSIVLKDYYRFRFRKPDSGTPKLAVTLQDTVAMTGILAVIIGIMATGAAHGKGDLNGYTFTMITSGMYFWLMAKFSEDYPIVARWLIVIPAALLATAFSVAFLLTASPNIGDLIGIGIAVVWFLIAAGVSFRQLRQLERDKGPG